MTPATTTPTSFTPQVPEATKAKLKSQSKEFETYYIQQFISLAMPDVDTDSTFSGGFGEQMFRQNLQEAMAKNITQKGGFGIADQVYAELLKAQEQALQ